MHKNQQKRKKEFEIAKMVDQISQIEQTGTAGKMPVQRYFTNTFGEILTHALYELQRKQIKNPDQQQYFTEQGIISYIAGYITENMPEAELAECKNAHLDESNDIPDT